MYRSALLVLTSTSTLLAVLSSFMTFTFIVHRVNWEKHCRAAWDEGGYTRLYFVCERDCLEGINYAAVYDEVCVGTSTFV